MFPEIRSQDALQEQHAKVRDKILSYYSDPMQQRDRLTGLPLPPPSLPHFVPHDDLLFLFFCCGLSLIPSIIAGCWISSHFYYSLCRGGSEVESDRAESSSAESSSAESDPPPSKLRTAICVVVLGLYVALLRYTAQQAEFCNPWPVLGLEPPPKSSADDARRAFRALSKMYHPDKLAHGDHSSAPAVDHMKGQYDRLTRAYRAIFPKTNGVSGSVSNSLLALCATDSKPLAIGLPAWMDNPDNVGAVVLMYAGLLAAVFLFYLGCRNYVRWDAERLKVAAVRRDRWRRSQPWRCPNAPVCSQTNDPARMHCVACDARRNYAWELQNPVVSAEPRLSVDFSNAVALDEVKLVNTDRNAVKPTENLHHSVTSFARASSSESSESSTNRRRFISKTIADQLRPPSESTTNHFEQEHL